MASIALIGLGLSMDAFCVSITSSLSARVFALRSALLTAVYFGAFQFLMPVAGYFIAGTVSSGLSGYGPFISFFLLSFIGVKMAWGAFKGKPDESGSGGSASLNHGRLLVLAVATSIDALAVGVSFAFLDISIFPSSALIGLITFAVCAAGGILGRRIPVKSEKAAETAGGLILVAIGVKILIEGLV